MSETPISLIDDKKSSQIAYNSDQILNNERANAEFFSNAEYSVAHQPPEFEPWKLEQEAPNPDPSLWAKPDTGYVQAPEFARPPKTHEDELKETVSQLSNLQCLKAVGAISIETVSMRHLMGRLN